MLARLSRGAVNAFNSSSRTLSVARSSAKRQVKAKTGGFKFYPLKPLFCPSPSSFKALNRFPARLYSSEIKLATDELVDAIGDFNAESTSAFDQVLLEDLLVRNGWQLTTLEGNVSLTQTFADAEVTIEICTESPQSMDALGESGEAMEEHDDHHHHGDHEHGDLGVLKGQMDYFNIVVQKKSVKEKLIFSCHAKEGILEIDNVTLTNASYAPAKPSFILPYSPMMPSAKSELASDTNNRVLSFPDLPPALQSSFESYLQEHAINHDLALIIYYSLYKHDLQYDQEWSIRTQKFLSAKN